MTPGNNRTVTVILIDDIRSVVEGIAAELDWEQMGMTVCGKAFDGEEAMRMIERERPDVILTDIRMPKLDGLEVSRKAKEMLPGSKVLLMTGFTDFEYAQHAVQLGAFDFIAKPFSLEQVREALLKAKRAVEMDRGRESELRDMKLKVKESMPVLRQEFFHLLIRHRADADEARSRWEFLDIDMEPERLTVLLLEIDRFAEESKELSIREVELTRFALQNIVEETISAYTKGIVFRESLDRFVVVMNTATEAHGPLIAEACRENIEQYTRFTISIGVGGCVPDMTGLSLSYDQAVLSLSYHFYTGGNGVFAYQDVSGQRMMPQSFASERQQELVFSLQSGNRERALALLDAVYEELSAAVPLPDPEYGVSLSYEIAFTMLRAFQEKVPYAQLAELDAGVREWRMARSPSLQELHSHLCSLCLQGCSLIERGNRSEAEKIVEEAIRYIRGNLHQELTVGTVARQVHLSGSYFANLFKKTTGSTFNQFVTHEKMERAKKLLLEDLQVQEIAESLGYMERRYFSDVFKKHTEMTPSEFKQTYMGGGGK